MRTTDDVIVVGGGLAGLSTAALAARTGARVRLLERGGALGGRARSTAIDGWTLNMGPHALYESGGGAAVLDRLGVDRRGGAPPTRASLMLLDGRLVPLPTSPAAVLACHSLRVRDRLRLLRALAATVGVREDGPLADVPIGTYADRTVGAEGPARAVFDLLVRLATYSADAGASAAVVLRQMARGADPGVTYVHGGWQRLVDGLHAAALDAGAAVVASDRVTGLRRQHDRWEVHTTGAVWHAPSVVLAVGGPRTVSALAGAHLSEAVRGRLAATVSVRAAALDVALTEVPPDARAPLAFGADAPLYLSVHSAVADLAPHGGAVVHVARYHGRRQAAPEADRAELEGFADLVLPGWRDRVRHARFLPDMTVTHDTVLAQHGGMAGRVEVDLAPGLHVAGDWVGDRGLLADAALLSAERAAESAVAVAARRQAGLVGSAS